jgi:hypothetical protein
LSKVTVVAAAVFMLTALSLAVMSKERSVASSLPQLQQSSETPVQTAPTPPGTSTPGASIPVAPPASDSGGHEQSHAPEGAPSPPK